MKSFDCVIIGGGMVGASCALSLAQLGLTVAIVEKNEPCAFSPDQNIDFTCFCNFSFHLNIY